MKNILKKQRSTNKTAEQVFSLALLASTVILMLVCLITRLTGKNWLLASFDKIPNISEFWQDRVMNLLFIFEMVFTLKILTRKGWLFCLAVAVIQTAIVELIPKELYTNIFNLCVILIIPICCTRDLFTIVDSIVLYAMMLLYGVLFLIGRTGNLDVNSAYNFKYNVVSILDYKLFIAVVYFYTKYYGGIKLWKTQKRLFLQHDLTKQQEK